MNIIEAGKRGNVIRRKSYRSKGDVALVQFKGTALIHVVTGLYYSMLMSDILAGDYEVVHKLGNLTGLQELGLALERRLSTGWYDMSEKYTKLGLSLLEAFKISNTIRADDRWFFIDQEGRLCRKKDQERVITLETQYIFGNVWHTKEPS